MNNEECSRKAVERSATCIEDKQAKEPGEDSCETAIDIGGCTYCMRIDMTPCLVTQVEPLTHEDGFVHGGSANFLSRHMWWYAEAALSSSCACSRDTP